MISDKIGTDFREAVTGIDPVHNRLLRYKEQVVVYLLIIVYVTISLLPLLSSGFYSDDLYNSTLKGQLELQNTSFVSYYLGMVKQWVTSNGRFLPIILFITSIMSYTLYNVMVYKVVLLLFVIMSVLLFGWLVEEVSGDRYISYLSMLFIPLLIQFRLYHDPVLSHYGNQQIYTSLIICSLIYCIKFNKLDNYKYLLLSLFAYNLNLYMSELSILLISLFVVVLLSFNRYNKLVMLKKSWPFIVSMLVALIIMIVAREFKDPTSDGYAGTKLSLNIASIARSFSAQLYATLPLSYYLSNPSLLFQHSLSDFISKIRMSDVIGLILFICGYFYAVNKIKTALDSKKIMMMVSIGLLLIVCPAFMISLSEKYQKEVLFGIGYIQIYLQYFGLVLGIVTLFMYVNQFVVNRQNQYALHACMCAFFSIIFMINIQNNRLVIEKSNTDMHYRRLALISALKNNLLGNIPEQSVIVIKDEYDFDRYSHVFSDTKAWAQYGYTWSNSALVYMYTHKRMNVLTELDQLKQYATVNRNGSFDVSNIYLLTIKSYPVSTGNQEGFVLLSKIVNLSQGASGNVHFQSQPVSAYFPKENG